MHPEFVFSRIDDDKTTHDAMPPRRAVAGGSGNEPPQQEPHGAEIIPFPQRALPDEKRWPAPGAKEKETPDVWSANIGAAWAAWMTSVLSGSARSPDL